MHVADRLLPVISGQLSQVAETANIGPISCVQFCYPLHLLRLQSHPKEVLGCFVPHPTQLSIKKGQ